MKIRREFSYVQIGVAALSMILWFLLPVFSFILLVPLYNISGMTLANRINQIMFIPLVLGAVMIVGAVMRNKPLMIVAAAIQLLVAILTIAFKKECIVEGNGKFIIDTASLLLNAVQDKIQQWLGTSFTGENIREIINVLSNYMQPGLGWVLHIILTGAYLLIACLAPKDEYYSDYRQSSERGKEAAVTTPRPNPAPTNTGYKHHT